MRDVSVPLAQSAQVRAEAIRLLRARTPDDDGTGRWFLVTLARAVDNVRRHQAWERRVAGGTGQPS